MNRQKAKEILGDSILPGNGLHSLEWYLDWRVWHDDATLDGLFNADELEAIAWWMRNTKKEGGEKNGKENSI